MNKKFNLLIIIALLFAITPAISNASIVKKMLYALGAANLNPQVQRDILADGWRLYFGQNYLDQEFDVGNAQITLNGPIQGHFSISKRAIPEFEYHIETPTPITFDFLEFDGVNKMQVQDGTAYIKQDLIINKYGFYDIQLRVSLRGTLTSDDPLDIDKPLDFDIGPINIHGHWLVDLLNLLTAKFSNNGTLLPGGAADTIVLGWYQENNIQQLVADEIAAKFPDIENQDETTPTPDAYTLTLAPVPEPTTLTLIIFALSAIITKRKI